LLPRPSLRTRSVKRKNLRTPGSRNVTHYYRSLRSGVAKCSACGARLSGVPKLGPSEMSNIAKSKKRPSRPHGGFLCPRCLSSKVRAKVFEEMATPEKGKQKKQS